MLVIATAFIYRQAKAKAYETTIGYKTAWVTLVMNTYGSGTSVTFYEDNIGASSVLYPEIRPIEGGSIIYPYPAGIHNYGNSYAISTYYCPDNYEMSGATSQVGRTGVAMHEMSIP